MPVEVYETTPPQEIIGVFPLPELVGEGDILRVDQERAYVIKRVASNYKYTNGGFSLQSKRADATEVSRATLENKLSKLIKQD